MYSIKEVSETQVHCWTVMCGLRYVCAFSVKREAEEMIKELELLDKTGVDNRIQL